MIIKNYKLLDCIENAITEYDNQLYNQLEEKEYEDKKIDFNSIAYSEDGESADIPDEILRKIDKLRIPLKFSDFDKDELKDFNSELCKLLDIMNLKVFNFSIRGKGTKFFDYDISFLNHINQDIENLSIIGVDLSSVQSERFKKFKNLKSFGLRNCNISNPNIISSISPEVLISLEGNDIAPEYYNDALKLIQIFNGKIKFTVQELETMAQIYSTKRVELNDYIRLMEVMDFDGISGLTLEVEDEIDFENINSEQIVNALNGKNNILLKMTYSNLSKLDPNGIITTPTRIVIKNASELTGEELAKHQCVKSIQISDAHNSIMQQAEPYSRDEYESVRKEIDAIISQITIPDKNDSHREKKIFSQVYKILGQRINYDHNAISKEEKSNERLQITCRNLTGGLLENKCVCAGYADILRNVLACTGIYAEFVRAPLDFENGVPMDLKDPAGHAWNLVKLDGKKYWTDLTLDANHIKNQRFPLPYCLKSTREFKHDSFKKRLEDSIADPCLESVTDEEQITLFTGKELDFNDKIRIKESKNIGYLSSCVMSIADSGLTSTRLRKVANKVSKSTAIKTIGTTEKEKVDGRG